MCKSSDIKIKYKLILTNHLILLSAANVNCYFQVYIESYNEGCLPVKKYDMVGLYFPTGQSIMRTEENPSPATTNRQCFSGGIRASLADVNTGNKLADTTFDSVIQPYPLEIEVFYYSNGN